MLDLLIVNGHVIDPANNVDEVRPVAIYNGQIVRYEEGEQARHTIDAAGKYVFPGLIDAHAHMFSEGTDIGTYPDLTYLPTGVTAAVDASAGVSNYRLFRSAVIERSKVTIKSFLQVCSAGLVTKIRQSEELAEGLGIEPLRATVAIADKIGCPVEVHCTNIPVSTEEVLNILRPGDIFEHVYQGVKNTILDDNGKLYDCVPAARKRGIIFDTAEGRKHGDYDVMLKAKEQGFIADFCSTDLVLASSYRRPIFSLPNLMSRYVAMGIPLKQVVQMTTAGPAHLMKMDGKIGCLSEGARADVAIFSWLPLHQTYRDWKGTPFVAEQVLKPEMTLKDGDIVYCAPDYLYEKNYQ